MTAHLRRPFLPGDWACLSCTAHNDRINVQCYKCNTLELFRKNPLEFWLCACANLNWINVFVCAGCKKPKSLLLYDFNLKTEKRQ
jgi:hypothetical protein